VDPWKKKLELEAGTVEGELAKGSGDIAVLGVGSSSCPTGLITYSSRRIPAKFEWLTLAAWLQSLCNRDTS